jgi:hypothetical protein
VDLGPILRGEVTRLKPSVGFKRSDGLQLLYPGKEHACIGEMECGKSWLACACVAAELVEQRHVVYIHFEEADATDTVQRLQALGVSDEHILAYFKFVGPETPVTPERMKALIEPTPSLVVLDGVNEAMSLHGQAIREEDGAAAFRRRLVKPFTAVGAAVLSLDRVVKDRERRDRAKGTPPEIPGHDHDVPPVHPVAAWVGNRPQHGGLLSRSRTESSPPPGPADSSRSVHHRSGRARPRRGVARTRLTGVVSRGSEPGNRVLTRARAREAPTGCETCRIWHRDGRCRRAAEPCEPSRCVPVIRK